jgi:hypothetical protein
LRAVGWIFADAEFFFNLSKFGQKTESAYAMLREAGSVLALGWFSRGMRSVSNERNGTPKDGATDLIYYGALGLSLNLSIVAA